MTAADLDRFAALQARLKATFPALLADARAPRTVVILPSLSLDQQVMAKVSGVHHYEERMLCLLLLLRLPATEVIFLSSSRISESIIDYYLHLLPGIPAGHARRRLRLIACDDASATPLTAKILARPRLLARLKAAIRNREAAHMTCFTVTPLERQLAVELDIPIYGTDPALAQWGTKSGSRKIFRSAGIDLPSGFEDLDDMQAVAAALTALKRDHPALAKAVVKLNDGFSGEGNAVFDFSAAPDGAALARWVRDRLPALAFEARGMTFDLYQSKLRAMGGIVEEFLDGPCKRSPSVQFRVDPGGALQAISTHDQVLGGPSGQIFLGARFPADAGYRLDIQATGFAAARALADKGVLGRFGIDFLSVWHAGRWRHVAIEINLRKGGTTHPFIMLQYLTDGHYDAGSGEFLTPSGAPRSYFATDNLESQSYRGLTSDDLVDIAVEHGLHFHAATAEGVAFHLIGALSEFGKLGVVAIGRDAARAEALYRKTVAVLDAESVGNTQVEA